jgi:hypothetical protein
MLRSLLEDLGGNILRIEKLSGTVLLHLVEDTLNQASMSLTYHMSTFKRGSFSLMICAS